MSELINTNDNRSTIRWKLLTSASVLALAGNLLSANLANAEDSDPPLIWIELGGQMENISGQGGSFAPAFLAANPNSPVLNPVTPLQAQRPPKFSFGEEGKITFQPTASNWLFSAAVRIGRSSDFRHVDHQTNRVQPSKYIGGVPYVSSGGVTPLNTVADFADTKVHHKESHAVLDFSAGRDVGLGLFGANTSSTVSLGVRFAQFATRMTFDVRARPDLHVKYLPSKTAPTRGLLPYWHTYHASGQASRSFKGVGPSLSWTGSAPFAGNQQDGEIAVDWGANAAIIFGRQKAIVQHHESGHYVSPLAAPFHPSHHYALVYDHPSGGHNLSRTVSVPNLGGSIGLSWRAQNFKVSFGYRVDFFLGAMDTGIDARKSGTLGFKGPYASVSVGLGD